MVTTTGGRSEDGQWCLRGSGDSSFTPPGTISLHLDTNYAATSDQQWLTQNDFQVRNNRTRFGRRNHRKINIYIYRTAWRHSYGTHQDNVITLLIPNAYLIYIMYTHKRARVYKKSV